MARPRRLLTVAHSYVVRLNRRLAHEMALVGGDRWEVVAVAPQFFHGGHDLRPLAANALPDEPIRVEYVPAHLTRSVHLWFYGRRLAKLLKEPWDLVHCWEEPFVAAGAQVARLTPEGTPLVCVTAQNIPKKYPPPFNWFEKYSMRRAAGWVAFSQGIATALGDHAAYRRRPMRIIPMGVDTQHFRPQPEIGAEIHRTLGWEANGPPVIGFLGRFTPEKGLHVLMGALQDVRGPWRALIVGAGPMEAELRAWAQTQNDRVRVCSNVAHEAVPAYLNAMNVLAAPSLTTPRWREQFGRMLIEGFACGLPVVGSDSGEIPYVIGDAGRVVPEGNRSAWAQELSDLIDSPDRRRELGDRGLERAHARYAWSVVARQHLDFFTELLEAREREGPPS